MHPTHFRSITDFHRLFHIPGPSHPLISLVNYPDVAAGRRLNGITFTMADYYTIAMKRGLDGSLRYGRQAYDFNEGILYFMAPGQTLHSTTGLNGEASPTGWLLLVHPDLLWGTPLAKQIKDYAFFGYAVHEALFLSEKEEAAINGLAQSIQQEAEGNLDKQSQSIIASLLETLLNYSERFYRRQFLTRKPSNHELLSRLEALLAAALSDEALAAKGLPEVQWLADQLHVSPNYLGTLLKLQTGLNTQQHIHLKLMEKAKEKLSNSQASVSEIAYELGFGHSQSFSKLFKAKTGLTPLAFRRSLN